MYVCDCQDMLMMNIKRIKNFREKKHSTFVKKRNTVKATTLKQ